MIVVTGASGQLGRLVVEGLLQTVPAAEIVAVARTPEKVQDLAGREVTVRQADYSQPETWQGLFRAGDKVLLISSSEVGQRVAQHGAVIDAAKSAGVALLAYTSLLRADTTSLLLAPEHKATEELLRASGVPFVMLRNGWYTENQLAGLGAVLEHGALPGAAGEGRFSAAARADYAGAAVAVLTGHGHENKIYELAGDHAYTLSELAAEISRQSGKAVVYRDMAEADYAKLLESFGLPAPVAHVVAGSDTGAQRGELDSTSKDLRLLLGRETTPFAATVAAALESLK